MEFEVALVEKIYLTLQSIKFAGEPRASLNSYSYL